MDEGDEIEVTPKMIEAGMDLLNLIDVGDSYSTRAELLASAFRAMLAARRKPKGDPA